MVTLRNNPEGKQIVPAYLSILGVAPLKAEAQIGGIPVGKVQAALKTHPPLNSAAFNAM